MMALSRFAAATQFFTFGPTTPYAARITFALGRPSV